MAPCSRHRVFAVLLLATAAFGGCGDSTSTPATTATVTRATGTPTDAPRGDATAGRTVFETKCQVCHLADGAEAGAGPQLVGMSLTEDAIRTQVKHPRHAMPPNIVSGKDLDDVAAFILRQQ